jgi:phosphoribosyl 1,2-cyclic phosphodiesterase
MAAENNGFTLKFWGVRGSIAAPGPDYIKYGGNTSCVEVRCGGDLIIIDMGTGARPLGLALFPQAPVRGSIFFSHYHYDHIGGMPFCGPLYDPRNAFDVYGEGRKDLGPQAVLSRQMSYPFFPIPLKAFGAKLRFHSITAGDTIALEHATVKTASLNHPQTAIAYRIEYRGKSLVYCSDNEHQERMPAPLAGLIRGCDVLVYDAAYTDDEYLGKVGGGPKVGWGHSTWTEAINTAKRLRVKKLFIFHHDPMHSDQFIDQLLALHRPHFKELHAAREGWVIELA